MSEIFHDFLKRHAPYSYHARRRYWRKHREQDAWIGTVVVPLILGLRK